MGLVYFFAALTLSCFAWGVDVYHHELLQYPRGVSCEITAAELAKRFSDASGAEIYWAGASKESAATCDVKISYIADKELSVISAIDRSGMGASRKGTRRTLAECTADLQREKNLFKLSTGLDSWVAYCYQESNFLNDLPFVPVVEGIGNPALNFYSSDGIFGVTPNIGWTNMLTAVWKTASDQGIPVASLNARPYISAADRMVTVRYYAKERLYLRVDGIAQHKSPEICEGQVEEIGKALEKAQRPPIGVYCGKYSHGDYRLGIVSLSTNIFGMADLKAIDDSKQFTTLEACRADLPSTIEFYRTKLGKKILAGICANGKGRFQITLLEEKIAPPASK